MELNVCLYVLTLAINCICSDQVVFFRNVKRILFVPYALSDRDAYAKTAREKFESLGKASFGIYRPGREPLFTYLESAFQGP